MITIRPANERGHANFGWLDAFYTFSFANYYDPNWMGFRALRVINDDKVAPGRGFGRHPHQNMEILTYMISGSLSHNDSTGGSGAILPGELQHMSAGTGVEHSEQNASSTVESHSLQIWIEPNTTGVKPQYQQKRFRVSEEPNQLHLLASSDGRDNSFRIHADADLLAADLKPGVTITHNFRSDYGYLHIVRGEVSVAGAILKAGDGLALSKEKSITLSTESSGEILLFDLE